MNWTFKMPVGDVSMPQMHVVKGVRIGTAEAYVRYQNRRDLVIFEFAEGTNVAGVFTQNAFCAAPVHVSKAHLKWQIRATSLLTPVMPMQVQARQAC